MLYIADETLERFLKEDVPYLDLTTWALGIGASRGKLSYYCRDAVILCGTEEVKRLAQKLDVEVVRCGATGERLRPGTVFFEACGRAEDLHRLWKVGLNILEYASGIATRTGKLVEQIRQVSSKVSLVTTRKNFPGTKELAIKGVLAGGGVPHRLGLSETVLIFRQHRNFLPVDTDWTELIGRLKVEACEKKVIAEAEGFEEALELAWAGVDGIQFDKVSPGELRQWVAKLREVRPELTILAAGGVTPENAAEYAGTGVNALVTTAVYFGKPADFGTTITPE